MLKQTGHTEPNTEKRERRDSLLARFYLALRRLKIKSLDLYSYFKSRINRTSHRRRSAHSGSLGGYISFLRNWRKAAYTSTVLLTLLTLAILFPISFKSADNLAEATAGTAQDSIITLSATKPTASVSLNVTSTSGSTATSSTTQGNDERATFTIATNNAKGYKLSIKSSSGTTLTNGTDTLDAIGTSGITLDTFSTNTWGYLPSYYNSTVNSTLYYPITTSDVTLRETNTATSSDGISNPDTYTIALGLKADYTKSAGTYTNNNIILTAIANPTPYTITYDKGDTTDTVDNIPPAESGSASTTSITLSSTVPTRTDYNFTGWCLGKVTTTNNVDSCTNDTTLGITAKTFQPGASFGIDRTLASNTATLHAMWSIKTFTVTKQYKLQDATGGYPSSYTADGTVTVNYGGSYTYTRSATTSHQQASQTISNVTTAQTISLDVPRKTVTVSLTKGTGISAATVTGTGVKTGSGTASATVYYDGAVTISATLTSGYDWVNWTGSATYINQSQSISNVTSNLSFTANGEIPKVPLYDTIAAMSKGTQTAADLQAAITTSNSGVYEYNASVFGTASDAANTSKIYYYRGILDETVGSYGSDGDGKAWPNYVILQAGSSKATTDTCWRIVRTTGSGGVKMIYNGKWTGSTCANKQTAAQLTTKAFNGTSSTYQQIVRIGYTYNSTYATNTAQSGTIAQIFGTNSTPTVNNTRSDIKTYIEDTWYASNMTAWTSKLEASAGYCNDRTMNTSTSWTSPLAESSTVAATYGTSGLQGYYYGAYIRNTTTAQKPSLTCAKYSNVDRSTVDLYRYVSGSTGVSNQLKYPVALLTADEVSFAGSGRSTATQGSSYHANSYLRSGSGFWLLSPSYRYSYGNAYGFGLGSGGYLNNNYVNYTDGVRPAISLVSGTTPTGGTGTATDPWVIK